RTRPCIVRRSGHRNERSSRSFKHRRIPCPQPFRIQPGSSGTPNDHRGPETMQLQSQRRLPIAGSGTSPAQSKGKLSEDRHPHPPRPTPADHAPSGCLSRFLNRLLLSPFKLLTHHCGDLAHKPCIWNALNDHRGSDNAKIVCPVLFELLSSTSSYPLSHRLSPF